MRALARQVPSGSSATRKLRSFRITIVKLLAPILMMFDVTNKFRLLTRSPPIIPYGNSTFRGLDIIRLAPCRFTFRPREEPNTVPRLTGDSEGFPPVRVDGLAKFVWDLTFYN